MTKTIYISLFISMFLLFSCEKALIEPLGENSRIGIFDSMWQTVDEKYAYFQLKGINWDAVRDQYRPLIREDMSDEALFDVLADMMFELRDGHVNIFTNFNLSRNWLWFLDSPQNFNYSIIERNYLGNDYLIAGPFRSAEIDSVGYIYYNSFGALVRDENIDFLIDRYKNLKGIIFDIRDNGGGSLGNVSKLVSRFADDQRTNYVFQYKNGPGHGDFGPALGTGFPPHTTTFTKPVIVLTNRSSYSASTFFAQSMSVYPHVTLVGDTTGGGGGFPWDFELPNGWKYRFSASRTFSPPPDFFDIEKGVIPDSVVYMDPTDEAQGFDSILETALEMLQ